ncbi:hypothetical protein GRI75_10730 [Altererythrobacter soli]|uniref:Uncharacterized protein n=1 Tax=Croceibacterium soli TaxID=1739690 RepID=A0A6I4UYZ2_9SPHN|nr:hypothetical protein [Croceibacterium soli]MXP42115.1 hypothetical protein [Croceibacterium soli]
MDIQDFRRSFQSDAGNRAIRGADDCQMATAAEMMFFSGAPLAHVVAYREHLRLDGIARRNQQFSARLRRSRSTSHVPIMAGRMAAV